MRNSWAAAWRQSSIGRFSARHPRAAPFLGALVLAAFSTAWCLIQNPDFLSGYDFVRMHAFYKEYFRSSVLAGHLPLWNPFVGLGRPFLADIETETLYPPNLLVLPFGAAGGVALSVLLHQAVAIHFGALLGRKLGAGAWQGLFLGAGLALASPFSARLATGMAPVYCTLCWWPALLWLAACLQDQWSRGAAAGFAVVVALAVLAGNPPILFVEAFGLVVFLVSRIDWRRYPSGWRTKLGDHAGLAFAGVLGVGLSCAQLLPFAELVGQGNRPLHDGAFAVANGMPAASWLSLIFPTSAALGPNWEYDLYCGLVPFFGALGGLLLWRDRNMRALLGLGLAGALLAAGDRIPILGWAVHLVPGASALRLPSRYGIWFATSILGLAAVGLSRRPTRPLPLLVAGFCAAAGWIIWLRPYVVGRTGDVGLYYCVHLGALGGAALLVGLWHARSRLPAAATAVAWALAVFCAADWIWAIRLQAPVYSRYGFHTREGPVGAWLREKGLAIPGGAPPRISFQPEDLCENAGMTAGFSTYNSYANPGLSRVWNYLHVANRVPESAADFIRLPHAIYGNPDPLGSMNLVAHVAHPGGEPVENGAPDPRAYVAFDSEVAADWRAAEDSMAAGRSFHSRAILEEATAPAFHPAPGGHASRALITQFLPERVVVRTSADAPAILVLGEAWYPGWRAEVDGSPAAVFPVNGWMRGVVIPAGDAQTVFTFHPRYLPLGLALSAASAAILAALALGKPRGRRASALQTASRIL